MVGGVEVEHLQRLEDRHFVVLGPDGEINMALRLPPDLPGIALTAATLWANCAWDSLAILAALGIDAEIEARWLDDDTPVDLRIENAAGRRGERWVRSLHDPGPALVG